MAQLNFDATNVPHDIGFDVVPAGWYKVMMDESEMKPTREGDGAYLACRFNIIDGQFTGRKLFARLNLRNANPTAQEIGFKQLSAIAHAVGVLQVADSAQLHNIPLQVRVKIRKDKDGQYEDQNEITSYKNINEVVGAAAAAPAAAYPPPGSYPPPPAAPAPGAWGAPPPGAPPAGWGAPPPAAPAAAPQGAWQPPQGAQPWGQPPPAPAAAPAPAPAPAPWTPPAGGQPWAAQPPAAPGAAPAAAPTPPQPPHPAQGAVPPWQQPRS